MDVAGNGMGGNANGDGRGGNRISMGYQRPGSDDRPFSDDGPFQDGRALGNPNMAVDFDVLGGIETLSGKRVVDGMGVAGMDGDAASQSAIVANPDGCPLMGNQQSPFGGYATADFDAAATVAAYQFPRKIPRAIENNPATPSFDDNPDVEQAEAIADGKDISIPFHQNGSPREQGFSDMDRIPFAPYFP